MIDKESSNTSWQPTDLHLAKFMVYESLADFKVFLRWVKTKDEAEGWGNRPYPTGMQYLDWLADSLQNREENPDPIWCIKSRRLMATWTWCAYILWRGIKNGATHSFIQSTKLENADFLVRERVGYIYDKLPYWFKYVAFGGKVEPYVKEAKIRLPNGALVWGFPQGPDVARQFTASIIFVDEAAEQDRFEEAVTAIMPLAEKKTEVYFVSTARPTFFGKIISTEPASEKVQHLRGVTTWDLKYGGKVWDIAYEADPHKDPERDGAEWLKTESKKWIGGVTGTDWLQEMERIVGAKQGELVYDAYKDTIGEDDSAVVEPFDISLFDSRFAVIDWGIRNPTCVLWIGGLDDKWYIYREWCQIPESVESFKSMFRTQSVYLDQDKRIQREEFVRILVDPASDRHDDPRAKSVFHLLRTGKHSIPLGKANKSNDGIQIVREWLAQGRLKVFSNCTRTRWEFTRYVWAEGSSIYGKTHNPKETPVDKDNHAMDDIKYFGNLMRVQENKRQKMARLDPTEMEIERILNESEMSRRYYRA